MLFILCGVIIPILFTIYNIICYFKKRVIYTIRDKNFVIVDDRFFKIQLGLSLVNAIFISGLVYVFNKKDNSLMLLFFIIIFWGINYLAKYIGILKKYSEIKK